MRVSAAGRAGVVLVAVSSVATGLFVMLAPTANRFPRDVAAFRSHALPAQETTDRQVTDDVFLRAHPDLVLAEGDLACHWLPGQPSAPHVDPSGASSLPAMTSRYLQAEPDGPLGSVSALTRGYVVAAAWSDLCREDRFRVVSPATLD